MTGPFLDSGKLNVPFLRSRNVQLRGYSLAPKKLQNDDLKKPSERFPIEGYVGTGETRRCRTSMTDEEIEAHARKMREIKGAKPKASAQDTDADG